MEKYNLNEGNESLKRILLMMKYDNKKTLSENVEAVNEQGTQSTFKNIAVGAGTGAATGAVVAGVGAIPGAVVGGLIGLVSTFIGSQNFNSTKKLFEGCKSDKSPPTLSDEEFDKLSDSIYDAIDGWGTDEEAIKSVFESIPSIPDLCGLIKTYSDYHGDLFSDLDGDLEGDKEWKKYVWVPLRKAMRFTNTAQKQVKSDTQQGGSPSKYKQCQGPEFSFYCINKEWIVSLQKCIGAKPDGYFGPKTLEALNQISGFENFTENDTITTEQIKSICNSKQQTPSTPQQQDTIQTDNQFIDYENEIVDGKF
jgi:hypothetical protein